MAASDSQDSATEWPGDLLDRKVLADHLSRSLASQSDRTSNAGITAALDGDWGTGKTFFVKRWMDDLKVANHPVIYFDAWANDIGDEASIALMSSVLSELTSWERKLTHAQTLVSNAEKLRRESINKLRRALVPVSAVILKGLTKKALGTGIDQILEAAGQSEGAKGANHSVEDTLDKLFELRLDEHQARQKSIVEFRSKLDELLKLILEKTDAKPPVFIFVDELDRCRPLYAIKLLEEIKHIFGVPDVVYVVSTNIDQLQNSVRAIYGAEFDGRRYLGRLFDRVYALPEESGDGFSGALLKDSLALQNRRRYAGLPQNYSDNPEVSAWQLISRGFNLDLRSQKQVFALVDEVINVIPNEKTIHLMWLFFLCACQMRDRGILKSLIKNQGRAAKFDELLASLRFESQEIKYLVANARSFEAKSIETTIPLGKVLSKYFELSGRSSREIFEMDVPNRYDYPANIINEFKSEFGGTFHAGSPQQTTVSQYAELVLRAGQLVSRRGGVVD